MDSTIENQETPNLRGIQLFPEGIADMEKLDKENSEYEGFVKNVFIPAIGDLHIYIADEQNDPDYYPGVVYALGEDGDIKKGRNRLLKDDYYNVYMTIETDKEGHEAFEDIKKRGSLDCLLWIDPKHIVKSHFEDVGGSLVADRFIPEEAAANGNNETLFLNIPKNEGYLKQIQVAFIRHIKGKGGESQQ